MKANILILALIVLALSAAQNQKEPTVLTYVVEHEVEQEDNFVQISLSVQTEGAKLQQAVKLAASVNKEIEELAKNYCLSLAKNKEEKTECERIVEIGNYQV